MTDHDPSPPNDETPLDHLRDVADRVIGDVAGGGGPQNIQGPESYYLLDPDLKALIEDPMAELGLPLEEPPATIYDYDPSFFYHIHRVPLESGFLAMVYLRNRITEAYEPSNNLAQLFDWLTQANPDQEVKAICFFTDGASVDLPYKAMAETWVRRGIVRFVEFIDNRFISSLRRMPTSDQRKVALSRIFARDELAPAAGAGEHGGEDDGGGGGLDQLDQNEARKNEIKQILATYLRSQRPAVSVLQRASSLIDSTSWPEAWKNERKAALIDNDGLDASGLVEYAIDQRYIPDTDPQVTALGNLLERIKPSLGPDQLQVVEQLIADYNL